MSIILRSKEKKFITSSSKAAVKLEDGIWRFFEGQINNVFVNGQCVRHFDFICGGEVVVAVDRSSFRLIRNDTPEEEIYEIICRLNVEHIVGQIAKSVVKQCQT